MRIRVRSSIPLPGPFSLGLGRRRRRRTRITAKQNADGINFVIVAGLTLLIVVALVRAHNGG